MSDIQKARDVLKKWRDSEPLDIATFGPLDEPLIVGTAGDPDLLDAIDMMLGVAIIEAGKNMHFDHVAKRIATAILAADERMSA